MIIQCYGIHGSKVGIGSISGRSGGNVGGGRRDGLPHCLPGLFHHHLEEMRSIDRQLDPGEARFLFLLLALGRR